jgi:eukaryotic-like serine/threonine-protein kinase
MNKTLTRLKESRIFKHILLVIAAFFGFILLISLFLRWFTHHGEALILPDYTGEYVELVMKDAKKRSFELVLIDSVFVLGKNGGMIISQNPLPGERVKRRRKVYLTVTKSKADEIPSGRLPVLYGKSYERKSRELERGFQIFSKIIDYRYDAGPENYILAVLYEGDTIVSGNDRKTDVMIEKGGTLEFVVSKTTGGYVEIPNLICKTYAEALFLCKSLKINLSEMQGNESLDSKMASYVNTQDPRFTPGVKMTMGDTIYIQLNPVKPIFCDDLE